MTNRIGFACKWLDSADQIAGIKPTDAARQYTDQNTTVAWLKRQTREVAEQRLYDIMVHNIDAVHRLIKRVGEQDAGLRMVRLSSNLLPVYTEPNFGYFWLQKDVRDYCERAFSKVGDTAKAMDVRLSMHPGQFVVLASDNPEIVERSIAEFEYHTDIIRWMGYGQKFQDFKCNIHISGRKGAAGIRDTYKYLSPEARNCITVENEENVHGLDDCLELADIIPCVLDIHHYWVRQGQYISRTDHRIDRILDSWRGVRPVIHYSVSTETLLAAHCVDTMPNMQTLNESGIKKGLLRAHSDYYWNKAVNDYALTFADQFDIMCESKAKNLASAALYAYQQYQK